MVDVDLYTKLFGQISIVNSESRSEKFSTSFMKIGGGNDSIAGVSGVVSEDS